MEVPNSPYRITETLRAEVSDAVARAIREGTAYADLRASLSGSFDAAARSLPYALQNATEHPNCVRGFMPRPDLSVVDAER